MKDTLVLTEKEKVSDCMTTFFIRVEKREYTGPSSMFVDGTNGFPDKEPVQVSMPPLLTPTHHAPTTLTNDVERLEKKIDDL